MDIQPQPPSIIADAIPLFLFFLLLEIGVSAWEKRDWFQTKDTLSSLSMGIGNVLAGVFTKGIVLGAYLLAYEFRLWTLPNVWWVWVLLFFAEDLTYYVFHRASHEVRYFWASHVVHHSSQKYNLGTALRQTWTGELTGAFVFWLWLPFAGFHPIMVMTMQSVSLLYQFFIHTEAIKKLPAPIEFVFNTPSHHRVHHATNLQYLDKNHAGILIIWDRLFGTFQPEQEQPVYGLTKNIRTFNPLRIAFGEWWAVLKDLGRADTLKNACYYLFGPPGWSHDGATKTTKQLQQEADRAD